MRREERRGRKILSCMLLSELHCSLDLADVLNWDFLIYCSLVVGDILSFCSKLRSCLSLWETDGSLPDSFCWVPLIPLGSFWVTYIMFPGLLLYKTHTWSIRSIHASLPWPSLGVQAHSNAPEISLTYFPKGAAYQLSSHISHCPDKRQRSVLSVSHTAKEHTSLVPVKSLSGFQKSLDNLAIWEVRFTLGKRMRLTQH